LREVKKDSGQQGVFFLRSRIGQFEGKGGSTREGYCRRRIASSTDEKRIGGAILPKESKGARGVMGEGEEGGTTGGRKTL